MPGPVGPRGTRLELPAGSGWSLPAGGTDTPRCLSRNADAVPSPVGPVGMRGGAICRAAPRIASDVLALGTAVVGAVPVALPSVLRAVAGEIAATPEGGRATDGGSAEGGNGPAEDEPGAHEPSAAAAVRSIPRGGSSNAALPSPRGPGNARGATFARVGSIESLCATAFSACATAVEPTACRAAADRRGSIASTFCSPVGNSSRGAVARVSASSAMTVAATSSVALAAAARESTDMPLTPVSPLAGRPGRCRARPARRAPARPPSSSS